MDKDGTILDVNQRIFDWLGYKPKEIIGTNFIEVPFLPEESKTLAEEKLYHMALGKDEPLYELTFMTKKGEKRVGQVLSNPIRKPRNAASVSRPITVKPNRIMPHLALIISPSLPPANV